MDLAPEESEHDRTHREGAGRVGRTRRRRSNHTLYSKANSWYMGGDVPGKPRVFTPCFGGVGGYRKTCDEVAAKDYEGLLLSV